jgi:YYY domain-containing protein
MIDLNSADVETLVRQLRISPRLARRIVAMRPFESMTDLQKVWGMDAKTYAWLVEQATVSPPPTGVPSPTQEEPPRTPLRSVEQVGLESPPLVVTHAPGETVRVSPPGKPEMPESSRPSLLVPPQTVPARPPVKPARRFIWALFAILLCGAYLRFVGLNWDAGQHQHPDERFITMVAEKIHSVSSIVEYLEFDPNSSLNPLPYGSYTYGMFPLFVTRYVAEWVNMTQYDRVVLVGRALSGLFDLAVVAVLYWLGTRLYDRRVGLLAAALSAAAVLPIQLSHFFTVDSFSTVFVVAGFCFAAQVSLAAPGRSKRDTFLPYGLFGLMTGLAMACKVNTLPLFGVILLAGVMRVAAIWKQPVERASELKNVLLGWSVAALVAAIAFRVFQPFAFAGPGFFGLRLSERWLSVMREVTDQVAGKSEWPPNHHWTSRPFTYAWTNMVTWGMGLPLGLTAWLGWAWAAWRCVKGEWRRHLLPVVWIAGYFLWQNIQFWRYMRYFLPIYPLLILLAAWALVELFDRTRGRNFKYQISKFKLRVPGIVGLVVLVGVLATTYAYAFAFTGIYLRPHTRIAASRWILENLPGPLNVIVNSPQGTRSYPLRVSQEVALVAGQPVRSELHPVESGTATTIAATHVRRVGADLHVKISTDEDGNNVVTEGHLMVLAEDKVASQTLNLRETTLERGQTYYVHYALSNSGALTAKNLSLRNETAGQNGVPLEWTLTDQAPGKTEGTFKFAPGESSRINRLFIGNLQIAYAQNDASQTTLEVKLTRDDAGKDVLAVASVTSDFMPGSDGNDPAPTFSFPSVELKAGTTYYVFYQVTSGGPLTLAGESMTLETSWDDALPLRVDNYDPLGGIYAPLNLELYEPDTIAKREKMLDILSRVNYIIVPSNRAYDAMPRLPLRYPMTLKYYQALFNCNCSGDAMEALAARAEPPLTGPLGFELVATFESYPTFGPFALSDQTADESFTVYDHPKVMIFRKTADFSVDKVRAILESADLTQILNQSPMAVTIMPTGLRLPPDRLAAQKSGGTWHEMFDLQSFLNQNQVFGVLAWYLVLLLLGWLMFPLMFIACPGLADRGYPLARLIALLFVAWIAWMLGSLKILPFTQGALWLSVGVPALIGGYLAVRNRTAFIAFIRARWRYLLNIEGLFLVLFLFDLAIRLGNPDLWHPWLGGEKPMDFAFFNSVLKAVYFPPENPWFAGNYVNYYYYGYVIAAVLTKLLSIVPSIAFNLVLPTWFAMTGVGAFCVTYNVVSRTSSRERGTGSEEATPSSVAHSRMPYLAGVVAVILMLVLGNLYQVRQLWQYLPEVSEPGQTSLSAPEHLVAAISGASRVLSGQAQLPGDKGRWYFGASRPILHDKQDTPIAEFPFFSFLYADLHPHVLAMPILFAVLAWILGILLTPGGKRAWSEHIATWFVAGLVFGAIRPTHTWDLPTLLGLGVLALVWKTWRTEGITSKALLLMAGQVALLVGLAMLMYYPFAQWFGTEYTSLELWKGARTPLMDYLTVHGLFLFILVTFLVCETREWLRNNRPAWLVRAPGELLPGTPLWVEVGVVIAFLVLVALWISNYQVLVVGLPLLIWAGLLLMRKNSSMDRQIVLGLMAVGVGLTMFVEVVVLQGDVGRSNTVFRFYIQVWALFSVAAAVALMRLIPVVRQWSREWRWGWWGALAALVLAAGTYTVTGAQMKMADRWPDIAHPPSGLDGMAYMLGDDPTQTNAPKQAVYMEGEHPLVLSTDYAGIRFMQDHVIGTPTIVEGQTPEYRWGSRYSIYTGLPTVVGWSWHVRQHNSLLPGDVVENRIAEAKDFYNTTDSQAAIEFLRRYQVEYIVVGDLERALYSPAGIAKFSDWANRGWVQQVFSLQQGASQVAIYKVVYSQ